MKHIVLSIFLGMVLIVGAWLGSCYLTISKLGEDLAAESGLSISKPWTLIPWFLYESQAYPNIANLALAPLPGAIMVFMLIMVILKKQKPTIHSATTYGSSRFATDQEIKASGLICGEGVMLGLTKDKKCYLRHDGPEHILVFAPTRSGKGVGIVIPTLLSWKASVVVHDIKGENWQLTKGWRSSFSTCLMFNPTSLESIKYNPLLEVRQGMYEIRDVQTIADMLVDPDASGNAQDHWSKTAHSLLVAAILHILYTAPEKSLATVVRFLSDPDRSLQQTLHAMLHTLHLGDSVHPIIAELVRELLNKSDNELSGVYSTALSFLGLYRDPVIRSVTSKSDFRLHDLMFHEQPISLYLVVPPSDIHRTRPLIRLMLNQMDRCLTESFTSLKLKHRLLLLIDEFPTLGRLHFFETSLAYNAGYGIKALLIAQSLNQIDKTYTQMNAILDNCHIRVAFACNDDRTAKRISDLLGQTTIIRKQESYSGKVGAWQLNQKSVSDQEVARSLLTPSEIMALDPDDALVFVSGMHPIRAKKIRYYNDQILAERAAALYQSRDTNVISLAHDWEDKVMQEVVVHDPIPTNKSTGSLMFNEIPL